MEQPNIDKSWCRIDKLQSFFFFFVVEIFKYIITKLAHSYGCIWQMREEKKLNKQQITHRSWKSKWKYRCQTHCFASNAYWLDCFSRYTHKTVATRNIFFFIKMRLRFDMIIQHFFFFLSFCSFAFNLFGFS